MDLKRLKNNICDNIYEAQAKLGYEGRQMSLNYMNSSLDHILGENFSPEERLSALKAFAEYAKNELGEVTFSEIKNGFCITIPEQGTAYVHNEYDGGALIIQLVEAVRTHASLEHFFSVFKSFSPDVVIQEMDNDEFQYLIYYENGVPNDYRYCLSVDEEIDGSIHISYHRFIKEDYDELGF